MSGYAARVRDPIEHTFADMAGQIGFGLSAVVAFFAARVDPDPVSGVNLAISIVTKGTSVATSIGRNFKSPNAGHIKRGARTVGIGPKLPPAARITDPLACSSPGSIVAFSPMRYFFQLGNLPARWWKGMPLGYQEFVPGAHGGAVISEGSATVRIERLLAARVNDRTSCGGVVRKGCDPPRNVVWIGGPTAQLASAGDSETQELDQMQKVLTYAGDAVGLVDWKSKVVLKKGAELAKGLASLGKDVLTDTGLLKPAPKKKGERDFTPSFDVGRTSSDATLDFDPSTGGVTPKKP